MPGDRGRRSAGGEALRHAFVDGPDNCSRRYVLSPLDVRDALLAENIELPSGRIEGESVELPIKTHDPAAHCR